MGKVIGIDLGTVNSCAAYIDNGVPTVIPDEQGRRTTPSVFAISANDEPVVGHPAHEQAGVNRQNTIFAVKRFIGLKYDDPEVKTATAKLPYQIVEAKNGDAWVEVNGRSISPEEVSANVLVRIKDYCEAFIGEKVTQAVITVPAHFNDSQRQATKDAARIAGLDVLRVLNEPTAAALAYGLGSISQSTNKIKKVGKRGVEAEKIVAVFDLGGGTFDISILALRAGVFDVLSTQGDTYLGGEDFDQEIVNWALAEFFRMTGEDISANKEILQKLRSLARDAKHQLSNQPQAEIKILYATPKNHLDLVLDRRTMEKVCGPIMNRLLKPCEMALTDAGLLAADVDDAILVGGMTRMLAIKKLCKQVFSKEPIDTVDPDEAVAVGAAIQAGVLHGLLKGVSLQDVTSLSLGIEIQGGMVQSLIPRNTKVPTKVGEVFTTSSPNQDRVSFHLVQGESSFAPDNISLGLFDLRGIRPAPRGEPRIEVALEIDGDGIVHLTASDLDTGENQKIDIVASSGLSDAEIDNLLRRNVTASEQRDRREGRPVTPQEPVNDSVLDQVKGDLRAVIYMTQFRLDKEGKNFRGNMRATLEACLASARTVLEASQNAEELQNNLTALSTITEVFEQFLETR